VKGIRLLVSDPIQVEQLELNSRFKVDYRPGLTRDALLSSIGEYDGLVVRSRTKVDREVLEKASRLKMIARPGTGLDNIDVKSAEARGIQVFNSPEALVEAVSEHVILLMLALARGLVFADASLKAGNWMKETLLGSELRGKTLGVVGLGRIGRRVAELSKTFGMSIVGYDVVQVPKEILAELEAKLIALDDLLSASDFVTIHVPLTPETHHLFDHRRLSMMKRGARLINTSRGGVIDEKSLVVALKTGRLSGAALDVFETEPPSGGILSAPNVILTPHVGGQTIEAQSEAMRRIGEKIKRFFEE